MRRGAKTLALVLAGSLLLQSLPARAEFLTTEAALATEAGFVDDRARLQQWLDRTDVQEALVRNGVSVSDAAARVAALSDAEAAALAGRVDSAPAGGDVLGVVVFVFLVLLVTDILGLTKVFPFTRPIR